MKSIPCDDGGLMLEVYRSDGWGQVNVRTIPPGARVGGHRHPRTNERWLLLRGRQVTVEIEGQQDSTLMPWTSMILVAGTGHAIDNGGAEEAVLLFWRDRLYDPQNVDKEPWNDGDS